MSQYYWKIGDILATRRKIIANNGQTIPIGSIVRINRRQNGYHIETLGRNTAGKGVAPNEISQFRAITGSEWASLFGKSLIISEDVLVSPLISEVE